MYKFAIKTLGCKVNQYEEQLMRENFVRTGLFCESDEGSADVIIVNSCTVTAQADRKTAQFIRKARRENKRARMVVTGCYVTLDEDIKKVRSMPEVDLVVPGPLKNNIVNKVVKVFISDGAICDPSDRVTGFHSHTRAFLKIQDGCVQNCSYCKVHLVRNILYSKDINKTLKEFSELVKNGFKEIVLTGICLGSWRGGNNESLADLLERIDGLQGDFRVRLSSLEPNHITRDLLMAIRRIDRIARHLHIPLQSGSSAVLKKMRRPYDPARFIALIEMVRKYIPVAGITMDIITGFPGETINDHVTTRELIERCEPSRLHVFSYSDRKGTDASIMGEKVPHTEIKRRTAELIAVGKRLENEFCGEFTGKTVRVLVEKDTKNNGPSGYSGEYVLTKITGPEAFQKGSFVDVTVIKKDESSPVLIAKKHEKKR